MRVLIIGLDGASWNVLNPLIDEGRMPFLQQLQRQGAHGTLTSTILPVTPVAWTSFQTGLFPGHHGVYGFEEVSRKTQALSFQAVNSSSIRARTVWDYLGRHGKQIGLLNLPMTYPPSSLSGFLVAGFPVPSQDSNFTYPRKLKQQILQAVPDYQVPITSFGDTVTDKGASDYIHQLTAMAKSRAKAALYLMTARAWDVMMVHFQEVDFLQHPLWHYLDSNHRDFSPEKREIAAQFFTELDTQLAQLSDELSDDDLLLILSDHGFQPMNKLFYPNRWLQNKGYQKSKYGLLHNTRERLLRMLCSIDYFGLRKQYASAGRRLQIAQKLVGHHLDWNRSLAYADASGTGDFGIHFLDNGNVPQLQSRLIDDLYRIKNSDTQDRVVKDILSAEDAFGSAPVGEAPQLVVRLRDGYAAASSVATKNPHFLQQQLPGETYQVGIHHPEGVLIANGRMVKRGFSQVKASILDIVPTLLYHLDLPIPSNLDGDALLDIYNQDSSFLNRKSPMYADDSDQQSPSGHPQEGEDALSEAEEEQIRRQLEDLGYLG